MAPPVLHVAPDGLICPEVGSWAEDKYRIISLYQELFATGMKRKWDKRVYIDLYSGAGYGKVKGSSLILKGAALSALSVKCPFDKYIFCEANSEYLEALRQRSNRTAPSLDIDYVHGDCHLNVDRICALIPSHSRQSVLSLCFVDPFDFGINFGTIRKLSDLYVDFLVLLAVAMDANRNYEHYVDGESDKIDVALGNREWRERWRQTGIQRSDFRTFLASEFSRSMESLRYFRQPVHQMKHMRDNDNHPLYYIALFSRHQTAYDFWADVLKYGTDQQSLEFEG